MKERRVAIDTTSLAGGEASYLKCLPLAVRIGIARSAGAMAHLPPGSPSNFDYLFLDDKGLDSISSAGTTFGKNLFITRNTVGLVLGAQKRIYNYPGARQIPVVMSPDILEQVREERPENFRTYELIALEYLKNKLINVTTELFAKYNIRSQDDLDKLLKDHNATGFCFDMAKSRFLEGSLMFEWVMSRTILVTIPVFKGDLCTPQFGTIDTDAEGIDLIKDKNKTETSRLLKDTKLAGFEGTYVLSFDISKIPGLDGYIPYPKDVVEAVKPLVNAVKSHA